MAILTVWRYDTSDGARHAQDALVGLAREQVVLDAACVTWEAGTRRPRTHQLGPTLGAGTLGVSFWGLLFGLVFYLPLLGAALGAAMGSRAGSLAEVGIDDTFVNRVRDQVTPGTSALFVLTSDTGVARLQDTLAGEASVEPTLTYLTGEQEAALREVFGETAA
jgi:uncharacterized membrane protein